MGNLPAPSHIMSALYQPHIMATPTEGFPLGLVAFPRAENQGENLGLFVQVGGFDAYTPEELPPVVITELGWAASQEISAQGQNVSDQKTNTGYGFPESFAAPEVPLRLGAPSGAFELYEPFRGAFG